MEIIEFVILAHLICLSSAIVCKKCDQATSIQSCNNKVTCNQGERCFTKTTGFGSDMKITMGCKSETECISPALIGRALPGRYKRNIECSQCCSLDTCNQHLCAKGTQVITDVGHCADDPAFDCRAISTAFGICSDIEHAKATCRKWCGLCDLVDGAWTVWSSWSKCDSTCGNGRRNRVRTCTNPQPAHGGLNCSGSASEVITCQGPTCPVSGGWSGWGVWTNCSVSCGTGLRSRHRTCDNPKPALGGDYCVGDNVEHTVCSLPVCLMTEAREPDWPINYNESTGIFTCPQDGVYSVSLTFNVKMEQHFNIVDCCIYMNGDCVGYARASPFSSGSVSVVWGCSKGSYIIPLCGSIGDDGKIIGLSVNSTLGDRTTFSGLLNSPVTLEN